MDATISPVERELRSAKEALSFLNQLTSQAERGAAIDFERALQTVAGATAALGAIAQGQAPAGDAPGPGPSTTTGGVVVGGPSAAVYARPAAAAFSSGAGGSATVTELQRRRAQQVLSELQLIETTLRRFQRKMQQTAGNVSNVQQLLGGHYNSADRQNYDDLDQLDREQKSLQYARRRMQQMNTESQAVLQALQGQTARMGGTGDKIADMMESIGVSNTTILQIVRRNQLDAWLVYGGICCFIILMWYIWRS